MPNRCLVPEHSAQRQQPQLRDRVRGAWGKARLVWQHLGRVAQEAQATPLDGVLVVIAVLATTAGVLLGPEFQGLLNVGMIGSVVTAAKFFLPRKPRIPVRLLDCKLPPQGRADAGVPRDFSKYAADRHRPFCPQRWAATLARREKVAQQDDRDEALRQRQIARLRAEAAIFRQGHGGWEQLEPGIPCVLQTTAEVPEPLRRLVQPLLPESLPCRVH